ncbi:MAG: ribulose 1,5-bisphosphate carboxylase, partial [Clostridiaceae bacterium]|nr:ribulose 1,5-bisphosphate carboxylase [Clostridiaceae bacterium]
MIRKLEIENIAHAFPEVAFSEDYIIGTFQMRIKTSNVERLALAIASEQTTGTWIKVGADSLEKQKRFGAKGVAIYEVPDAGADYVEDLPPLYILQIAFPMDNFGSSLSMMLTTIFGNISAAGMLKWIDVAFPKRYVDQFGGPKYGVEGLRDLLGVPDRPLLNAMIKPNLG